MANRPNPAYPPPQGGTNVVPPDTTQYPLNVEPPPNNQRQAVPLTKKEKVPLAVYLGMVMVVEVLGIVDLSLHSWIRYCGARFGLKSAYSEGADASFSDLSDACDVIDLSDTPCGDYCSNITYMKNAGVIMQILGAFAIVLTAVSAVFVTLQLLFSRRLISKIAKSLLPIGMALWILGTVICEGDH
jgi:uncharacterized membrane protein